MISDLPGGVVFSFMRELKRPPTVFILIEDEYAFYKVGTKRLFEIAVDQAQFSEFKPVVRVLCSKSVSIGDYDLSTSIHKIIFFEQILDILESLKQENEIIVLHNASRPLVSKKIYNQGIKMLLQGVDAVKQKHVVVDTLKRVDHKNIVLETVDRDLVKAITTPEFYWTESICGLGQEAGWFYEIENELNKDYLLGELESTRVRGEKDLFLVSALIEQGRLN